MGFSATNNEVEYETLMMGMVMVQKMGGNSIKVFLDSRLVVGQVKGEFEAKDERMQGYLSQIKEILGDQSLERQCLVAAIQHKPEAKSSAHEEMDL